MFIATRRLFGTYNIEAQEYATCILCVSFNTTRQRVHGHLPEGLVWFLMQLSIFSFAIHCIQVDGELTLGENIADNGGLISSYLVNEIWICGNKM